MKFQPPFPVNPAILAVSNHIGPLAMLSAIVNPHNRAPTVSAVAYEQLPTVLSKNMDSTLSQSSHIVNPNILTICHC